jgi:dipeptidyl aminopeptidase/acylaminoacyl peptidase
LYIQFKVKLKTQLTQGNWEVRSVVLQDRKAFYLTTTTHPGNRSFYKLDISTKKMQPILTNDGAHEVSISPDESSLLVRYSYKTNLGNYMLQVTRPIPLWTKLHHR